MTIHVLNFTVMQVLDNNFILSISVFCYKTTSYHRAMSETGFHCRNDWERFLYISLYNHPTSNYGLVVVFDDSYSFLITSFSCRIVF